jgi:streptomycin 6-kinase
MTTAPVPSVERRAARLAAWRETLPARAARIAAAWGLRLGPVLVDQPSSRLVAAADAIRREMVLKLALPGQGLEAEAAALAAMQGRGMVALHRADPAEGALLMARAMPGTRLRELSMVDDDAATRIAARLVTDLPAPPPERGLFATAVGWGRALEGGRGHLPRPMLDRAAGLLKDLAADAPPVRLLHGDLHHANILKQEEAWVAVDPKGLLGEPAAEAACLLRNPADPVLLSRAPRRAAIIAETAGLDRQRILAWGYAGAVIAACWAIEDGQPPGLWLTAEAALRPAR